jgi:galactokinase
MTRGTSSSPSTSSDADARDVARGSRRVRVRACGRVCLLGEHSDWAAPLAVAVDNGRSEDAEAFGEGACVVVGTSEGLDAVAWRMDRVDAMDGANEITTEASRGCGFRFVATSVSSTEKLDCDVSNDDALERVAAEGGFWSYVAGTALEVFREHPECRAGGLRVDIHSCSLPTKKGLSSSAAVCVLIVRAFAQVYGLKDLARTEREMELAYRGEALRTPSKCGAMDQACAYGERVVLLRFPSSGGVTVEEVAVGADIHILVADLGAAKNTVRILDDLQRAFRNRHVGLREALGKRNREHVEAALHAIKLGDAAELGRIYDSAQAVFDAVGPELCPTELVAPALHDALTSAKRDVPHTIHGGKGVGSQGDGAVQFVCTSESAVDELRQYLTRYSAGRIHSFVVVRLAKNCVVAGA